MKLVRTDDRQFMRDRSSSAVLNIDTASYQQYKKDREATLESQRLAAEVKNLKQDITTIKMLLEQLVNGKSNV